MNLGILVIACIHSNPDILPLNKSDTNSSARKKLSKFRNKVMHHRMVSYFSWDNPSVLSAEVAVALINTINDYPRPRWERVVSYENSDLLNQINNLRIENDKLKVLLDEKNQLEQQEKLIEQLQWNELCIFRGYSKWEDYKDILIPVSLTWSQIFSILGLILLVERDIKLVHNAFNYALFLEHAPFFSIPDTEFQLVVVEFLKYGIIDVVQGEITLTKSGKQYLHTEVIPIEEELNKIHVQVMEIFNSTPKKKIDREKSANIYIYCQILTRIQSQ